MRSTSQPAPLRTVCAVPAHCWVPLVWTEVVLTATVAVPEPPPDTTWALRKVIHDDHHITCQAA